MLVPAKQVIFEGLSRDYYARQKELASSGFTGCVRLVFADFEGMVIYEAGKPVTAIQECGTWMALGDELIAPLENKAVVTEGSMAIYALSKDLINFFADRKIASTVETETGPLLGTRTLLDNLLRDRSVCIFSARGPSWIGYAFLAAGRIIDAAFASDIESLGGDRAAMALRQATDKATAVMYFLEGGAPFIDVTPSVVMPVAAVPATSAPVEVLHPPAPGPAPVETVIAAPAPREEPAIPTVDLTVVTSGDKAIQPRHPSKLAALESLEDRSVVLVDGLTLERLGVKDAGSASMVLPGGRVAQVMLLKMDLPAETGKFAVVPRKLRRRLAIVPGTIVTLKPGSALVPVR
ncbi:MAG TPA: hypothetical protein VGJ92_04325 [Methanocella sp.]|jgi:hypothetical protein